MTQITWNKETGIQEVVTVSVGDLNALTDRISDLQDWLAAFDKAHCSCSAINLDPAEHDADCVYFRIGMGL